MYTYAVTLFVCASGLFFVWYVRYRQTVFAVLFASSLALLVYTLRLVPHCVPSRRRRSTRDRGPAGGPAVRPLACAIPVVLVAGLYAKNWMIVGEPTTSTWMGMNMANMAFNRTDKSVLARDVKRGVISRMLSSARSNRYPSTARRDPTPVFPPSIGYERPVGSPT